MRKNIIITALGHAITATAPKANEWTLTTGITRRHFTASEVLMLTAIHMRDLGMTVYATPDNDALASLHEDGILLAHQDPDTQQYTDIDLTTAGIAAVSELKDLYHHEFMTAVMVMVRG